MNCFQMADEPVCSMRSGCRHGWIVGCCCGRGAGCDDGSGSHHWVGLRQNWDSVVVRRTGCSTCISCGLVGLLSPISVGTGHRNARGEIQPSRLKVANRLILRTNIVNTALRLLLLSIMVRHLVAHTQHGNARVMSGVNRLVALAQGSWSFVLLWVGRWLGLPVFLS